MAKPSIAELIAPIQDLHQVGGYMPPEPEQPPDDYTTEPGDLAEVQPQAGGALAGWNPFTLADAYEKREPLRYLVGKLFELPSLNVVYGSPGCLKSFLLADLALAVVSGKTWLQNPAKGGGGTQTTRAGALWLDFDNGKRRTHDRFGAVGRALGVEAGAPFAYYSMPMPWLDIANQKYINGLAMLVRQHGASLVVIDNLGDVTQSTDENTAQIGGALANLRALSEDTGAAIVLIHHQRKSNGFKTRAGETLRGHSSIEAALDCALLVEREERSDDITITATKSRGADIKPFGAKFAYENGANGELYQARFWGRSIDDPKDPAYIKSVIIDLVKEHGSINKTSLTNACKNALEETGIHRISEMIQSLVDSGKLTVQQGQNNGKIISFSAKNGEE